MVEVALHGNLRDFGIGEVFQLIGQQCKTGVLEVREASKTLRIAFESGEVVWAERGAAYPEAGFGDMLVRTGLLTQERLLALERSVEEDESASLTQLVLAGEDLTAPQLDEVVTLVTRNSVFELLRWKRGSFHFLAQPVAGPRLQAGGFPAEQILMDGLRMLDEWRTFEPRSTSGKVVLRRAGSFDRYRADHAEEPAERLAVAERLFLLIDGRLPSRRIVDLSRLGDFEGARLLSAFLRSGLVEALSDEEVSRASRRLLSMDLLHGPSPMGVILAVLPFVLLLVAVLGTHLVVPASLQRPPGIHPDPEQHVTSGFERQRLRNLVEAYRFARGRWPASLADLGELDGNRPLAATGAREYYYAQRGDSFLVLAPED
jgi:hypothetical protein